jgi:parallel beta-helix repeat protein
VAGKVTVEPGATGVTVSHLNLDGRPGVTSPEIDASDATFDGNDVTDYHTAICFSIVNGASNVVIENNKIHDCGSLPSHNLDHGIYVDDATGTVIRGNWIYHNADFGVHIYPNGDHTLVTGNVIDSNGEGVIFAGVGGQTSDDNLVEHNVITNSQIRQNVESSWGIKPRPRQRGHRQLHQRGSGLVRGVGRRRYPESAGRLHRD